MKPIASVSLDLDDLWTYLKTHGDAGWQDYPTYLPTVVPRVLKLLGEIGLTTTWFIVGRDAADPRHRDTLRSIPDQGHEIANHSFHHEPWLHLYSDADIANELQTAHDAIERATGETPIGFRGPGFSFSPPLLAALVSLNYQYDASTFPTFLGPLARYYYFANSKNLTVEEREQRAKLFGGFREGLRPLDPYRWQTSNGPLTEIPVTTMPILRLPIHLSYLLYLDGYSRTLAKWYFRLALFLCRVTGVAPSLLLHPLDFLGCDDTNRLSFFPAMRRLAGPKLTFARWCLGEMVKRFDCVPMARHAERVAGTQPLVPA